MPSSTQASIEHVTPAAKHCSLAHVIAAKSSSSVRAGASLVIRSIAAGSRKVPFGEPSSRLAIVPPSGSLEVAVIPETSSALLFTQMV